MANKQHFGGFKQAADLNSALVRTLVADANGLVEWQSTNFINKTHAEMVILKNAGSFIPGALYRITDFATIYDQPDFDIDVFQKTNPTVKTGPTEPLTVFAISTSELSLDAYQEDHPKDKIQYILEYATPVTATATKGRIIRRIDDFNNESDFDHRNVVFKRYYDPILSEYIFCHDNGEPFLEFGALPAGSSNNFLGDTYNISINNTDRLGNNAYTFDLPNIVLSIEFSPALNNVFSFYVMNFTSKGTLENNSIGESVNVLMKNGRRNKIDKMAECVIDFNYMDSNSISICEASYMDGSDFSHNDIIVFSSNTGSDIVSFKYNTINDISNNVLSSAEILLNNVRKFSNNTFTGKSTIFTDNNIGTFWNNTINGPINIGYAVSSGIRFCDFRNFEENTINGYFAFNKGIDFKDNICGDNVNENDFGVSAYRNDFGANFGFSSSRSIYQEYDSQSNSKIGILGGNIFNAPVSDTIFGSNCLGNIFDSEVGNIYFGNYLTNNKFENIRYAAYDQGVILNLLNVTELYESFKTTIFSAREIHATTYSLGDTFASLDGVYGAWYRSTISGGYTTNFFAYIDSNTNLPYGPAVWEQVPGTAPLGTIDGLDNSNKNSSLLAQKYRASFVSSIGLSLASIYDNYSYNSLYLLASDVKVYIPTLAELQSIYNNRVALGFSVSGKIWSSTEFDNLTAYAIDFSTGTVSTEDKLSPYGVIPIFTKTFDYSIKLEYRDETNAMIVKTL